MRTRAEFGMDATGIHAAAGMMDGVATALRTSTYVGSALRYTHGVLSEAFNNDLDKWAIANPSMFHHVYEWNATGVPGARLWKHHLRGRSRDRTATFEFLPSKVPVPVPKVLTQNDQGGAVVKEGVHIFVWKAPIMEYGLSVTIRPKNAEALAFAIPEDDPARLYDGNRERNERQGIVFTRKSVTTTPGRKVQGNFTLYFSTWWSGAGQERFNRQIKAQLERDLAGVQYEGYIQGVRQGRLANKSFSIRTPTAARGADSRAFQQAKREAQSFVESKAGKYDKQTAKRWRNA